MTLQKILQLLKQRYPSDPENGWWPALVIYDDESGRIAKDMSKDPYDPSDNDNSLFEFVSVQELIDHLTDAHVPAQPSLFDHEN